MTARRWTGYRGAAFTVSAALAASAPVLLGYALPARAAAAAPEATLDADHVPAAGRHSTLLHVTHAGRFSLSTKSASGTALQVVDMLTGPSPVSGDDGGPIDRLDVLLDVGTYKLTLIGDPKASGDAGIAVAGFTEHQPPAMMPRPGDIFSGELADLEQRSFWLTVGPSGRVYAELAGRTLADVQLWRNGSGLTQVDSDRRVIEPTAGHPLTDITLDGTVEPGNYLVTAYGGAPLTWADGTKALPFYVRRDASTALLAGSVTTTIGPFGSEHYRVANSTRTYQVTLPAAAKALANAPVLAPGQIARNSRELTTNLVTVKGSGKEGDSQRLDIEGPEGQAYTVRGFDLPGATTVTKSGDYWLSAATQGLGGDELPATVVLIQRDNSDANKATVLESTAPKVGPGQSWHHRFNLRGSSTLLVEVTAPGPVGVTASGVAIAAAFEPLTSDKPARSAKPGGPWDLETGYYLLHLDPVKDDTGILDLTIGDPSAPAAGVEAAQASGPVLPLGHHALTEGQSLEILQNSGPGTQVALTAQAWPPKLKDGWLAVSQNAGEALDVPMAVPDDAQLLETVVGQASKPLDRPAPNSDGVSTVSLPAPDKAATTVFSLQPAAPPPDGPLPAVKEAPALPPLEAGKPAYFTFGDGDRKSFDLDVAEGGLYRVETLGRLKTSGWIGTPFITTLAAASDNGIGDNMLLQHYLRAGHYRVTVAVADSAGRLGIVARPSPMVTGATLVPGGSVRAAMPAGTGLAFPLDIAAEGDYTLDLLGLRATFTARLEDADGWPVVPAGDLSGLQQHLAAGHYRLIVMPEGVDARVVARLSAVTTPKPLEGHGPHPLPFEQPQALQWREPADKTADRTPDQWDFTLNGSSTVSLLLSEGMTGVLKRIGSPDPVATLVAKVAYKETLPAGQYRVEARSLGRNDRLDYTISLKSDELQSGVARQIKLPATVAFSIATGRVVSLSTFGSLSAKAVLRDSTGTVIGRFHDRASDWNLAVSRFLPAGTYTLDLSEIQLPEDAPKTGAAPQPAQGAASGGDGNGGAADNGGGDDAGDNANGQGDTGQGGNAQGDNAQGDNAQGDNAQGDTGDQGDAQPAANNGAADSGSADTGGDDGDAAPNPEDTQETAPAHPHKHQIEVRLSLPDDDPTAIAATPSQPQNLTGASVHHVTLAKADAGSLQVVAAASTSDLTLALERQDASGAWQTIAEDEGQSPVVAAPAADGSWRVSVWTTDGGNGTIRLGSAVVAASPASSGAVTFAPVALGDIGMALGVAEVSTPGGGLAKLDSSAPVLQGSAAGRGLRPATDAITASALLVPQSDILWLLSRDPAAKATVTPEPLSTAATLSLILDRDEAATIAPTAAPSGKVRVWLARSADGQPGLQAGHGMGVAPGRALALAGDAPLVINNASGQRAIRLELSSLDLKLAPPETVSAGLTDTLPGRTARPLTLPANGKRLHLDLPGGVAMVANWQSGQPTTLWNGWTPSSWDISGTWTDVLLVNASTAGRPVTLSQLPDAGTADRLSAAHPFKRFFATEGTSVLALDAKAGQHLRVAGNAELTVTGPQGTVANGTTVTLSGPSQVLLRHGSGLVAVWVEGDGLTPWPAPAAQATALPSTVALSGEAMAFALSPDTPVLLSARTTAPVIVSINGEAPALFPAGAAFQHYLPAGAATLAVFSPQDGPLTGSLDLTASPVIAVSEGVGKTQTVRPGGSVLFGFTVKNKGPVGIGVRSDPDLASVRLRAGDGHEIGSGVVQMHDLTPGQYVLEADLPADAPVTLIRPAVVGLVAKPNGPPDDVVRTYLDLAGLAPKSAAGTPAP